VNVFIIIIIIIIIILHYAIMQQYSDTQDKNAQ